MKGEVGELLWKGMVPGGNPIVAVFCGSEQWQNRGFKQTNAVSADQAFLASCPAAVGTKQRAETMILTCFVLGYLGATQCGGLEGQCYNTTYPLMDGDSALAGTGFFSTSRRRLCAAAGSWSRAPYYPLQTR